ncbi:MAG: hypothetical protein Q8P85_10370 [Pseudomonas sp.]|nr:hypothetical protein [Pseudomonas sp.]
MRIERSTVTKLLISELMNSEHRLDPVTVFLEDLDNNNPDAMRVSSRGKIIIECYGKSWSSYWGGMGGGTVAQFFCRCSAGYLAGCLAPQLDSSRYSSDALVTLARKTIISRREGWRHRNHEFSWLDKEECRRLYDRTEELEGADTLEQAINWNGDLIGKIFDTTEPWHYANSATGPNPDYQYLCRIIAAVQEALRGEQQQAAA